MERFISAGCYVSKSDLHGSRKRCGDHGVDISAPSYPNCLRTITDLGAKQRELELYKNAPCTPPIKVIVGSQKQCGS